MRHVDPQQVPFSPQKHAKYLTELTHRVQCRSRWHWQLNNAPSAAPRGLRPLSPGSLHTSKQPNALGWPNGRNSSSHSHCCGRRSAKPPDSCCRVLWGVPGTPCCACCARSRCAVGSGEQCNVFQHGNAGCSRTGGGYRAAGLLQYPPL